MTRLMYLRQRKLIAVALLLTFLTTTAYKCEDEDLKKVADGLDKTVASLTAAQKVVIEANTPQPGGQKFLSDDATIKIGGALIKINEAVIKGAEATEDIAKLDTASREQIINILKPITKAVGDLLTDPAFTGIQNENTKTTIRAAIVAVQTVLNQIQLDIAVN